MYKIRLPVASTVFARNMLWLRRLNIMPAWEHITGNPKEWIANLDSGFTPENWNEFKNKPVKGYDTYNSKADFRGGDGVENAGDIHGIVEAALLCGAGGPTGMYGVAFANPLIAMKVAVYSGQNTIPYYFSPIAYADGIYKSISMGARLLVVTIVTGNLQTDEVLRALTYARDRGCLVVLKVPDTPHFMDQQAQYDFDHVLVVGGTFTTDETYGAITWGGNYPSGYGEPVDLAGPAVADIPFSFKDVPAEGGGTTRVYAYQRGSGPGLTVPMIGGIMALIWAANPNLSAQQVKQILLSNVDKSRVGWQFYNYFTKLAEPGVGIPDAEKCVLEARSTDPRYANRVFPYMRIHGRGPRTSEDIHLYDQPDQGVRWTISGQDVHITTDGMFGVELGGFCSAGPITNVQLWLDGVKKYDGVPTSRWADNLYMIMTSRNDYYEIKVVASTATGQTGTRYYVPDRDRSPLTINQAMYGASVGSGRAGIFPAQAFDSGRRAGWIPLSTEVAIRRAGKFTISHMHRRAGFLGSPRKTLHYRLVATHNGQTTSLVDQVKPTIREVLGRRAGYLPAQTYGYAARAGEIVPKAWASLRAGQIPTQWGKQLRFRLTAFYNGQTTSLDDQLRDLGHEGISPRRAALAGPPSPNSRRAGKIFARGRPFVIHGVRFREGLHSALLVYTSKGWFSIDLSTVAVSPVGISTSRGWAKLVP